jgi:hypothetical protein
VLVEHHASSNGHWLWLCRFDTAMLLVVPAEVAAELQELVQVGDE